MKNKLWCDLKTDQERVEFLRSGRAWETGIIAKSIVEDVAQAFERYPNKSVATETLENILNGDIK